MINRGDSIATVKTKIADALALVGVAAPTSWSDATAKLNAQAIVYGIDTISDRLAGGVSRERINAVIDALETGGVLNAFSPIKAMFNADAGDINGVVAGDSTGNAKTEFVYLFWEAVAALYPAYSFVYYAPDGSGGYNAPETIHTGSGPNTFRLYNNSISGSTSRVLMGGLFDTAFVAPSRAWDFIMLNYGKNEVSAAFQPMVEGGFFAALGQFQLAFPAAQQIVTNQYRNRDDTNMNLASTSWTDLVSRAPEVLMLDIFNEVSLEYSDFTDGVHASDAANASKIQPYVLSVWSSSRPGVWSPPTPWFSIESTNYLFGNSGQRFPDFSLDGDGTTPGAANVVPAGFTTGGTIAYSKETTITYDGAARSQKMQGSGAAQTRITRVVASGSINVLKGNEGFLTAVEYVPIGASTSAGRIAITPNGTGGVGRTTRLGGEGQGGWRIACLGPIAFPADMTSCNIFLYHDSNSSPDATHPVYYQWAAITLGDVPTASV